MNLPELFGVYAFLQLFDGRADMSFICRADHAGVAQVGFEKKNLFDRKKFDGVARAGANPT